MLKIIDGSFEELKAEMKQFSNVKREEVKVLKKPHGRKALPPHIQSKVDQLEFFQKRMYASSKVMPTRVAGLVINYKAYRTFMKKIERLEKSLEVRSDCIRLRYKTGPASSGYIDFIDISEHFQDFKHIPVAEITHHGQQG